MAVIDSVTAETIVSDECYECPKGYRSAYDGIFKKSSKNNRRLDIKVKCNMVNQVQLEKNDSIE